MWGRGQDGGVDRRVFRSLATRAQKKQSSGPGPLQWGGRAPEDESSAWGPGADGRAGPLAPRTVRGRTAGSRHNSSGSGDRGLRPVMVAVSGGLQ
ncbi:hypothetical protein NDU88_006704 [Pleurodeles waltl]|uniref:Uncharacterized protein n=1 Tax=Pleurodeles waltl TaxID=8319 RepID=A0AAV7RN84_PLEWA|nr:hypothetical protein NDU88_006704 [Pleurodeles waltl]